MSSKQTISRFKIFNHKFAARVFPVKYIFLLWLAAHFSAVTVSAQTIAFLIPEKNINSRIVNDNLETSLSKEFKILDDSIAESAAQNLADKNLFNLSREESQNLGSAVGCDFFVVQKAETLRRASLSKAGYYESYAVVYLVSSRTGHLVFWKVLSVEDNTPKEAEKKIFDSLENLAAEISANIKSLEAEKPIESESPEISSEVSPESKNFRPPLPYRRIKPDYTKTANLYNVAATVDAVVDLDETGKVLKVEITRWAGYGLDESVTETIKKMQWRAAEYNGRTLPFRVLLRYNFRKLKSEDDEP